MKPKKLLRYVLIVAVLGIILIVVGKKVGWFGKEEALKVAVEKVQYRDIIETITANGKVQPETEVIITPEVSGEIVQLNVKEGDKVEQGKLLVLIKPDTYQSIRDRSLASVNSAKARLAQAEASFVQYELSFNRNKKLWEQQAISEAEYENALASFRIAQAELDAAKYSVRSAEAALAEAEENLIKTSIYAPMSGTIFGLRVEKGERVLGTQMMTGTEMMRIADLTKMEVKVEVNENDIVRVSMADTAIIEVDAYLGEKFKGVVTEIANSASTTGLTTDQVTNFDVKVYILEDSYRYIYDQGIQNPFRPGMSATVDIQTDFKYGIPAVPIQAVTTRPDSVLRAQIEASQEDKEGSQSTSGSEGTSGSESTSGSEGSVSQGSVADTDIDEDELVELVFLVEEGRAVARRITTGIQDNNFIQIIEGIDDDDEIIVAPYTAVSKKLEHGSLVEVVPEDDLFKDND
jgi:HlyD family secretion protein